MRAKEVHRVLRDHLRIPGSVRVKSDPLVLSLESRARHLFLWIQVSRDGWVQGIGNKFVPTLCRAETDDFRLGAGFNLRIGHVLDGAQRSRATEIHNEVVGAPLPAALLASLPADVARHLRQELATRSVPFSEHDDLWFRYRSIADVVRWAEFVEQAWSTISPRAETLLTGAP